MTDHSFLHLLQLASSTLPVGAYSYSEGIETLVETGRIEGSQTLAHWLSQELRYGAVRLEAAVMSRGYRAAIAADLEGLNAWNRWLSAVRETEELRSQSWQMGRSLLRLLQDLQPDLQERCYIATLQGEWNFAIAFGIAAACWQIDLHSAVLGYLHSWGMNLISAGVKIIPLGQTAGQQVLVRLYPAIEETVEEVLNLTDDDLSSCGWGLALASMEHEIQYSRLFRS
jgi:urease accessory protein